MKMLSFEHQLDGEEGASGREKLSMVLVEDGKADFIQGGTVAIDVGTTAVGSCRGGKRLNSECSVGKWELLPGSRVVGGSLDGKSLRRNIRRVKE